MGRMKRQEIMNSIPSLEEEDKLEEFAEWMKDTLDYFESSFGDINDKLTISGVDDLDQISDAKEIAVNRANDLY